MTPRRFYADRGYDHDKYRRHMREHLITPVIAAAAPRMAPASAGCAGS
jgi:IS5 family transposase